MPSPFDFLWAGVEGVFGRRAMTSLNLWFNACMVWITLASWVLKSVVMVVDKAFIWVVKSMWMDSTSWRIIFVMSFFMSDIICSRRVLALIEFEVVGIAMVGVTVSVGF